ncbi:Acyl-CoA N-acyltransferase [Artemisia annua]|uniref:Acyl-CoA N-acyltransferase n=1 Tax=Artemisia annua TaxID=35608 RepID=A0A2U1M8C8_ARTAN|nr:Acyl-CoA N-acyltransferase [Artemisia annua]
MVVMDNGGSSRTKLLNYHSHRPAIETGKLSDNIVSYLKVTLEAEVTNKGALALYGRLGFIRAKRLFRYYLNGVDAFRLKLLFPHPELSSSHTHPYSHNLMSSVLEIDLRINLRKSGP